MDGTKLEFFRVFSAMRKMFPGCDDVITKPGQIYYLPSCSPELQSLAQIWTSEGRLLDWREWPQSEDQLRRAAPHAVGASDAGGSLDADQVFSIGHSSVLASEVEGRIEGVTCPFHSDQKGTEFLKRHDSGVITFTCKHCGTYALAPSNEKVGVSTTAGEFIDMDLIDWQDPEDRRRVQMTLNKLEVEIDANWHRRSYMRDWAKSYVLCLPEGAGKSRLTLDLVKSGRIVIFAVKSWKQAFDKEREFKQELQPLGFTVVAAKSLGGFLIKRYNVKPQRRPSKGYAVGVFQQDATIDLIMEKHPHLSRRFISASMAVFSDNGPNFRSLIREEEPDVIVTTVSCLRLIQEKGDQIPRECIVWIDDPDPDEVTDILPLSPKAASAPGSLKENQVGIDGSLYYERPDEQQLSKILKNNQTVYTTTEIVTSRLIQAALKRNQIKYQNFDDLHHIGGGCVTVLGTQAVHGVYDAMISLMHARLRRQRERDLVLIGNGVVGEYNHMTAKGVNTLTEFDSIVEISQPPYQEVKKACDALGLKFNEHKDVVSLWLMADKAHQAAGRNSGYRSKGAECVILVDKNRYNKLMEIFRYKTDDASRIIDLTSKTRRKMTLLPEGATELTRQVDRFINRLPEFFDDLTQAKADIRYVYGLISGQRERLNAFTARMFRAWKNITGVEFHFETDDVMSVPHKRRVYDLAMWVLDKFIPARDRVTVLADYQH